MCRMQYSLISSGKKNLAPGIAEKASLIKDQRRLRIGSGPWFVRHAWVWIWVEAYIESAVEVPSAEIELLGDGVQLSVIQWLADI